MSSARPDPLLVGAHRLREERHEDAVDDEPGPVDGHDDLLAELRRQGAHGLDGLVGGGLAADELDERHDRHRAEEVHADEPGPALRLDRLGQPMDRDRARVRGEDRGRRRVAVELAPQLGLDGERPRRRPRSRGRLRRRPRASAVGSIRASVASRSSAVRRPLSTARWRLPAMRSRPAVARARSGSYSTTCLPMAAWTWAMPWPISPAPATNTRSIVIPEAYPVPARRAGRACPARPAGARSRRTPASADATKIAAEPDRPSQRPRGCAGDNPNERSTNALAVPTTVPRSVSSTRRHGEGHEGREQEGDPEREDGGPDDRRRSGCRPARGRRARRRIPPARPPTGAPRRSGRGASRRRSGARPR